MRTLVWPRMAIYIIFFPEVLQGLIWCNRMKGKENNYDPYNFTFTIILLQSVCQLSLPASQAIINWLTIQSRSGWDVIQKIWKTEWIRPLRLNSQKKKMLQLSFKKMVHSDLLQLYFLMVPSKKTTKQNWDCTTPSVGPLCPTSYGWRTLGTNMFWLCWST